MQQTCRYGADATNKAIQEAIRYINRHFDEKLTLPEVASHVYLSKNYFSLLFRIQTGLTFTQYVNAVRVEKSKAYLRDENLTIGEVSTRVGFDDQSYFTKVFRQSTDLSPGKYRSLKQRTERGPICELQTV